MVSVKYWKCMKLRGELCCFNFKNWWCLSVDFHGFSRYLATESMRPKQFAVVLFSTCRSPQNFNILQHTTAIFNPRLNLKKASFRHRTIFKKMLEKGTIIFSTFILKATFMYDKTAAWDCCWTPRRIQSWYFICNPPHLIAPPPIPPSKFGNY